MPYAFVLFVKTMRKKVSLYKEMSVYNVFLFCKKMYTNYIDFPVRTHYGSMAGTDRFVAH